MDFYETILLPTGPILSAGVSRRNILRNNIFPMNSWSVGNFQKVIDNERNSTVYDVSQLVTITKQFALIFY